MGVLNRKKREIHAKIVLYGPEGAGSSTNLRFIHKKLKREHRGGLQMMGSQGAGGAYEFLPVNLGAVRGYQTSIHLYAVPPGDKQGAKRQELLDDVDGIVFVADLRPHRHGATLESLKELERHLKHHGRRIDDMPLVIQYNHRDEVEENAVESLHRAMTLSPAAAFESVASEGTGVLVTLTTLSKVILNRLRHDADADSAPDIPPAVLAPEEPAVLAENTGDLEVSIEMEDDDDGASKPFRIESGGPVDGTPRDLRIPIVLVDEGSGRRVELCLRLSLESG